jgi:hypothetical protein
MPSRPVIVGELTDNAKKFCLVAKMMLRWIISYHFAKYKSILTFLTSIFIPTMARRAAIVWYVRGPSGPLDQALGFEGRSFRGDGRCHELTLRPVHPEMPGPTEHVKAKDYRSLCSPKLRAGCRFLGAKKEGRSDGLRTQLDQIRWCPMVS